MRLSDLITELLEILRSGEQDLTWSSYASVDDAVNELEDLRQKISDPEAQQRLRFLCLPTGALEEIAISSGWAKEWLRLVNEEYGPDLYPQ
ncbi:hypothetical protein VSH64_36045 [Amycolatopsis rhabdoformis]|uniref:Uncharacterized protein n=1 Tax=Amycolatopsis rhabdoformis TaxID=1448059 RepID=A0ABZ1I1H1_9PSEU|nr:hypothetical protein [Amycolatopsis rhabdoformis]WSE28213.1 hypothetical protein VSH64_36045 [Amycolatopsis rhabdoformis]